MVGTFWAFVPAIVAIVLALITKQVYVSLFLGIFVGAMMFAGGNPLTALYTLFNVMSEKVGANVPIIVFLVVLGIIVILMQKSGGAKAYGDWAGKKIKTKSGALSATAGLGCLIFVDDYFNCLTVGSVMRPVTDKHRISRAKLAYIIDATAAPICIIAPISSWAAAVAGELEGDGLMVFISTIPFNIYALLTIGMVFALCYFNFDFGKMKKTNIIAKTTGDLHAGEPVDSGAQEEVKANPKGKVRHLTVPVIILIVCCIASMILSGFFYNWGSSLEVEIDADHVISTSVEDEGAMLTLKYDEKIYGDTDDATYCAREALDAAEVPYSEEHADLDYYYTLNSDGNIEFYINLPTSVSSGESVSTYTELAPVGYGTELQSANVIEAFSNCDAGMSLAIGSTIALVLIAIYYIATQVMSFKDITGSFADGFKAMVPAILILTFAWSISGIMGAKGGYLDAQAFVQNNLANSSFPHFLFPAIFFILAGLIAFSTGTSWGTFGVLVPISVAILNPLVQAGLCSYTLLILTVSATLGGAVFGDHISPISDTTILASAGAECNHVQHVNTQLPYASLVAIIAALGYIVAGACASLGSVLCCLIMWAVTIVLFVGAVFGIKFLNKKSENAEVSES